MSYSDFQAAIALMITKPEIARSLKHGDETVVQSFELSEKERLRLRDLVNQPGMALYCSLARANRLEAISEAFPMTMVVMEPFLREFLDQIWTLAPPSGYRLDLEIEHFSSAVTDGLADGSLQIPYLREVYRYECTCWTLVNAVKETPDTDLPVTAMVEFEHPPNLLLLPLSRLESPPANLPVGNYQVELKLKAGKFSAREIV